MEHVRDIQNKGGYFFMQKNNSIVEHSIFSDSYWKMAVNEKNKINILTITAFMIALQIAMSSFFIPVGENLKIYFSFVTTAVSCLIGGPVLGLCYGFIADNLGFILHPLGGYFPGYTISAMSGAFLYGIFFYHKKITVTRIFLCKLSINFFVNVLMGSLWSAMIAGKAYYYYFGKSVIKNTLMLPIEVILLVSIFQLILPILQEKGIILNGTYKKIPFV